MLYIVTAVPYIFEFLGIVLGLFLELLV